MSTTAIQRVVNELQGLPESDQELVLGFLQALKQKHRGAPAPPLRRGRNPAVQLKNGRLVFTGKLEAPHMDWVRVVREERDDEFIRQAQGLRPRP